MGLDKTWLGGNGFEIFKDRVEALHVPHLKQTAMMLRELDEFSRLRRTIRHWLLDEKVFPQCEQFSGKFEMRRCWRDNAQGITREGGFFNGIEGLDMIFI